MEAIEDYPGKAAFEALVEKLARTIDRSQVPSEVVITVLLRLLVAEASEGKGITRDEAEQVVAETLAECALALKGKNLLQ
jgi:hypothetical protein